MKCSKFCCTFASWIALLSLSLRVDGAYLVCYYNQTAVYRPGMSYGYPKSYHLTSAEFLYNRHFDFLLF